MQTNKKLRKKATLTPKLFNALLSNVKDSFYLIDNTVLSSPVDKHNLINSQIEVLLDSKLYGTVIVLGLRKMSMMKFLKQDFQQKFSRDELKSHIEKVELQAAP